MLLLAVVLVTVSGELIVRFGLERGSQIEGRTAAEQREIFAMARRPGMHVLVVGNSLLDAGVDFPRLREGLGRQCVVMRYVIEQTAFFDWFYGLRRLYDDGARADVVVLALDAEQMVADSIRDGYFAHRLMKTDDVLNVARDAQLSATNTFSLLVSNLSAFYGTRSETRNFVLSHLVPRIAALRPYLTPGGEPPVLDRDRFVAVAAARLKRMKTLVEGQGGRLILMVPATSDSVKLAHLVDAAGSADVQVIVPMQPRELTAADFTDGFHLSPSGAERYTAALIPLLRAAVPMF